MNFSLTFNIDFYTNKKCLKGVLGMLAKWKSFMCTFYVLISLIVLQNLLVHQTVVCYLIKRNKSYSFVFFGKQMLRHFTTFGLSTQKYRQNKIANNGSNNK